jgi:predicted Fe-Mo cluster-binding NifX family protein
MKVTIAATGEDLDAPYAPNFGRAENFIIVDTQSGKKAIHANPAVESADNKGVLAAQFVVKQGTNAVISGNFGPHAARILAAANVQMLLGPATGRDLLACYEAGQLRQFILEAEKSPEKERLAPTK